MALRKTGSHGLLVLDFDSTLTVKESISPADCKEAIDRAFGGSLRVAMIQHMLTKCRSHGIEVAIVSNTPRALIQQAMGRRPGTELLPLINQKFVFGSEDFQGTAPKSAIISKLLTILQIPPTKMMFLDDESCNVAEVHSAFEGAAVIQSPQDGIGRPQCEAVCVWCTDMLGGDALPQWTKHSPDMVWAPLHSNSPSSPTGNNPHWADTLFQVRKDVVRNETEMGLRV
jgi:HAD superfamily phosphatase (TIGR01681 family)